MSDVNVGGAVAGVASGEGSDVGVVIPVVGQVTTPEIAPVVATVAQTAQVTKPVRAKKSKQAKAKAKAKKVVAKQTGGQRGRPKLYTGKVAQYIAKLVNTYGATHARSILNAAGRDAVSIYNKGLRDLKLVPEALGISMPTVLKIAKENGVELHPGRPAEAA